MVHVGSQNVGGARSLFFGLPDCLVPVMLWSLIVDLLVRVMMATIFGFGNEMVRIGWRLSWARCRRYYSFVNPVDQTRCRIRNPTCVQDVFPSSVMNNVFAKLLQIG
mmetsp:Transcript_82949/g.268811  ORF Transcript_82949/g.268811 Transcript_82949/m.268811 type:complete len:107 (+) Transcript_82949:362-682(+)